MQEGQTLHCLRIQNLWNEAANIRGALQPATTGCLFGMPVHTPSYSSSVVAIWGFYIRLPSLVQVHQPSHFHMALPFWRNPPLLLPILAIDDMWSDAVVRGLAGEVVDYCTSKDKLWASLWRASSGRGALGGT